jgi:HSP20 family protein
MAIVRWDPFRELADVQNRMTRLFDDFYGRRAEDDVMRRGTWVPPVDIFEKDHVVTLKAELPDMQRSDIDIRVENSTLTISGEKKLEKDLQEEDFHRVERTYGHFSRSFSLPATIDTEKVSADYKNGVLTVKLPLREEAKPKQIQVQVNG